MWTSSCIQTFKQTIAQADGDGVVRVGHGETVTVRVPTHQEGSKLFWEFATDHYDIGMFFVYQFFVAYKNYNRNQKPLYSIFQH